MKTVQVLMSTYNGEKYLGAQIESILNQENIKIKLYIRDDGSSDGTEQIIQRYLSDPRVCYIKGNNIGYKKSFLWLLDNAEKADYYAFSDQDDVWKSEKLFRATQMLDQMDRDLPALYTSALERVDQNLNILAIQDFPNLKLNGFSEIVRHRFAGCTYVFNDALREKCLGASRIEELQYSHDGFMALMCWLTGGTIVYDPSPQILFRRHGNNTSADGMGVFRRIRNELKPFIENKKYKSNAIKVIKYYYGNRIDKEYADLINQISNYDSSFSIRIKLIFDKRFDCGMKIANILFKSSILLKCM